MGKITIKNISTATITITDENITPRYRVVLMPGREVPIKRENYESLTFDSGFNNLVVGHFIKINGLTDDEAVEIIDNTNVYDPAAIEAFFDKKDYAGFAKFLPNATMAEKDTVVELATKKGITDSGFTVLINKYCGVDVISANLLKHQAEEKQ